MNTFKKCSIFLALALPMVGQAATLVTASGNVTLDDTRVSVGQTITSGVITVASNAYSQLVLESGAIISVSHNSRFDVATETLLSGGVDVLAGESPVAIKVEDYQVKTDGFVRLRLCEKGCGSSKGIYGKVSQGEVIIEYLGGRAVFEDKPFYMKGRGERPQLQAVDADILAENNQLSAAALAKQSVALRLKEGLEAFKQGDNAKAVDLLAEVKQMAPTESIASYYRGLAFLELDNKESALVELQEYRQNDAAGAVQRDVNQLITLLLADKLQREVQQAISEEASISDAQLEPNTIAVQPFVNKGSPQFATLAKGIAAMIISDLSQVPGLKVLERQKVQKLLDEIRLNQSGLVEAEAMVKAGRLVRAEKVVFGNFEVQP